MPAGQIVQRVPVRLGSKLAEVMLSQFEFTSVARVAAVSLDIRPRRHWCWEMESNQPAQVGFICSVNPGPLYSFCLCISDPEVLAVPISVRVVGV